MAATFHTRDGRRWTPDFSLGRCRAVREEGVEDLLAAWETTQARRAFVDRYQDPREMAAFGRLLAAVLREPVDRAFWKSMKGSKALVGAANAFWTAWGLAFAGPRPDAAATRPAPEPDPEWEMMRRASLEAFDDDYAEVNDPDDPGKLFEPADPWDRLMQWTGEIGIEPWAYTWHQYRQLWIGRRRIVEEPAARVAAAVANAYQRKKDGRAMEPADFTAFAVRAPRYVARCGSGPAGDALRGLVPPS